MDPLPGDSPELVAMLAARRRYYAAHDALDAEDARHDAARAPLLEAADAAHVVYDAAIAALSAMIDRHRYR